MSQPTWTPEMAAELKSAAQSDKDGLRDMFDESFLLGEGEAALAEIARLTNENADLRENNKDNDENLEFLDQKMHALAAELAHEREAGRGHMRRTPQRRTPQRRTRPLASRDHAHRDHAGGPRVGRRVSGWAVFRRTVSPSLRK